MAAVTTIGFDADDTLWHNEPLFEETHRHYCELLSRFHDAKTVEQTLYETEMRNLDLLGYGVKAHAISSIETAIQLSAGKVSAEEISAIVELAKGMLRHPVELLDGAREVVAGLAERFHLLLITKGDLREQERKIRDSGLESHFSHVEILSDKNAVAYQSILARHEIRPDEFLMVGNSIKSDILPVLDLGGLAAHVPYHVTWEHERAEIPAASRAAGRFFQISNIRKLPGLVAQLAG